MQRKIICLLAAVPFLLCTGCVTQADVDAAYAQGKTDAYQAAYDEGFSAGYAQAETDVYPEAYDAGFYVGKDEGRELGSAEAEKFLESKESAAYWKGYSEAQQTEDGYQYGYDVGYQSGYWDGYQEASDEIRTALDEDDAWDWIREEYYDEIQAAASDME